MSIKRSGQAKAPLGPCAAPHEVTCTKPFSYLNARPAKSRLSTKVKSCSKNRRKHFIESLLGCFLTDWLIVRKVLIKSGLKSIKEWYTVKDLYCEHSSIEGCTSTFKPAQV